MEYMCSPMLAHGTMDIYYLPVVFIHLLCIYFSTAMCQII